MDNDDVIEAMARALDDGINVLDVYKQDAIDALRAAEQAGWRLVPVDPTQNMLLAGANEVVRPIPTTGHKVAAGYAAMLQAAPRPWEES